ncbi:MAG: hypothetical protein HPY53_13835 [Brevinematales bacterium]|nr:hypothetical protein [Brevinematales bacterium]
MRKIFSIIRLLISLPLAVNAWAPPETASPCFAGHIDYAGLAETAPLPMDMSIINR